MIRRNLQSLVIFTIVFLFCWPCLGQVESKERSISDLELPDQYLMQFLDLDLKLPLQYSFVVSCDCLAPRKQGGMSKQGGLSAIKRRWEGWYDNESGDFRMSMENSRQDLLSDKMAVKGMHERIKIKNDFFERWSTTQRVALIVDPAWMKDSRFDSVHNEQNMIPTLLPMFNDDFLRGGGVQEDHAVQKESLLKLIHSEETSNGLRGVWTMRPVHFTPKREIVFDPQYHLPILVKETTHKTNLTRDQILLDKGTLSQKTVTTWKTLKDDLRLPVKVECQTLPGSEDEVTTYEIVIEWSFDKDLIKEKLVPPKNAVDMREFRKRILVEETKAKAK